MCISHYETFRSNDKLPATYEVVYGHAWRPDQANSDGASDGSHSISLEQLKQELRARKLNKHEQRPFLLLGQILV